MGQQQLVIAVNGPGEVSAWLYPFATALKRLAPEIRIVTALHPCVFSSGTEPDVIRSIPAVDAVTEPKETMRFVLGGKRPEAFTEGMPGGVLHFGGEPFLSRILAGRLGYPAMAYAEDTFRLHAWLFEQVFLVNKQALPKNDTNGKFHYVGDMMVDAARLRCPERTNNHGSPLTIGLLPGSRPYQVRHMLPFYIKVAGIAAASLPETRWMVAKADFISSESIRRFGEEANGTLPEGETARWEENGSVPSLVSKQGLRFEIHSPGNVMANADIVLTVPGTNTAELASIGLPMIVLLPTYHGELNPLPGLLGHLDRIPLLGKYIKRGLAHAYLKRIPYVSHPNRRRNREVVPEVIGRVTATQIANTLLETLEKPSEPVEKELLSIMGPPGAADRLSTEVLSYLDRSS